MFAPRIRRCQVYLRDIILAGRSVFELLLEHWAKVLRSVGMSDCDGGDHWEASLFSARRRANEEYLQSLLGARLLPALWYRSASHGGALPLDPSPRRGDEGPGRSPAGGF